MRAVAIATLVLLCVACDESTSPVAGLTGAYTLALSNGKDLPDTIPVGGSIQILRAGSLEFFRLDSVRDIKVFQGIGAFGPGPVRTDTLILGYTSVGTRAFILYPSPSQFFARTDTVDLSGGTTLTVRTKLLTNQTVRVLTYSKS